MLIRSRIGVEQGWRLFVPAASDAIRACGIIRLFGCAPEIVFDHEIRSYERGSPT